MIQTAIVGWRAFPSADEVRAHQTRTCKPLDHDPPGSRSYNRGYGRWLCP